MKKKLLASVLALSLTAGLCASAFAAEGDISVNAAGEAEVTVGTVLNLPTLAVTIAKPADAIVNPYGLEYSVDGTDKFDTLISTPSLITNDSDVAVKISATPSPSSGSGVTFSTTSTVGKTVTDPTVFMFMELQAMASDSDIDTLVWTASENFDNTAAAVSLVQESGSKTAVIELNKSSGDNPYGAYKFVGDSAGDGWQNSHKFTLKIVFDIVPIATHS